jgi:hypothetical protein
MTIQWDKKESKFKEQDGTLHNKERCESLKQKLNGNGHNGTQDISLEILLKKLSSIGIDINLEKLRNA